MIPALALRYLPHALVAVATAGAIWWGYSTIWEKGHDACEQEHAAQAAEAAAADHRNYLAAVAWGNQISTQLAATQRQIATLKVHHEDVARILPGMCPDGLRVLHDAAAAGVYLPDASGASLRTPAVIAASAIASAIGDNYGRARDCESRLNALIDWHKKNDQ